MDRVVDEAGRSEKRRRLLSARFTVYFVLAMCLFPQADYLEVLRLVKIGDPGLRPWTGVNNSCSRRRRTTWVLIAGGVRRGWWCGRLERWCMPSAPHCRYRPARRAAVV